MKITLGPIPFLWGPEAQLKFYKEIAKSPIDDIFVGEVICSQRGGLPKSLLSEILSLLEGSGKKVYLSSLGLVTNDIELDSQREIVESCRQIEANDFSIVKLCHELGKEFIVGPYVPVYNRPSLEFLRGLGAKRVVLLSEVSFDSISYMIRDIGMETEILAFGKPHLAFSWRCYTARMYNLAKEDCSQVCSKYQEGCGVSTIDGRPIYSINGTEIMSATNISLLEQLDIIKNGGISHIRIIPQIEGTAEIAAIFRKVMDGKIGKKEGLTQLRKHAKSDFSNGWFFGEAGWKYIVEGGPASKASVEGKAPASLTGGGGYVSPYK